MEVVIIMIRTVGIPIIIILVQASNIIHLIIAHGTILITHGIIRIAQGMILCVVTPPGTVGIITRGTIIPIITTGMIHSTIPTVMEWVDVMGIIIIQVIITQIIIQIIIMGIILTIQPVIGIKTLQVLHLPIMVRGLRVTQALHPVDLPLIRVSPIH